MKKEKFGTTKEGKEVELYTLENKKGMQVGLLTYGATIQSIRIPDRKGQKRDVVLGYDTLQEYVDNGGHFGGLIGRNANRIGGASCTIAGVSYSLEKNDGDNNLHSGCNGFDRQVWDVAETGRKTGVAGEHKTPWSADEGEFITFSLVSPADSQDFPGTMQVKVTYTLTEACELLLEYHASTDAPTTANMTNHAYFNLAGHDAGTIHTHMLKIFADQYTPIREKGLIPTGELAEVADTPMDFRRRTNLGERLDMLEESEKTGKNQFPQLKAASGYDHNYVLNPEDVLGPVNLAADAYCPETGIGLELFTDCPGVQFYAANFVGQKGKGGVSYSRRSAFCLEPQFFPDSINQPAFHRPVIDAEHPYHSITGYVFYVE